MEVRKAALELLIKVFNKNKEYDSTLSTYISKVKSPSELVGLTSGTIKMRLKLDYIISSLSKYSLNKLSPTVLNTLRLALYEFIHTNTPDYAVINAYVDIIKVYNKKSAPFINAILRNYQRESTNIQFFDIKTQPVKAISVEYSHPEWMVEKWIKAYGIEDTKEICKYNNAPPKLTIRVNPLKLTLDKLECLFRNNDVKFERSKVKNCLILHHKGNITEIPGYNEGFWVVQGESSALVANILEPQENENILDLCAAPGGKTSQIAAITSNNANITAIDISAERLKKITENCNRLGISNVKTIAADASSFQSDNQFDRILIDAPCSNTGVLAKRPDARWNRKPEDIKTLSDLQFSILDNASKLVKQNGIIVYSTCSIEYEENAGVIERFLKKNSGFKLENFEPFENVVAQGYIQILQSKHNMDGFFIAKLRKTGC